MGDATHDYGKDSFDWANYDLNRPKYPRELFNTIFSFHSKNNGNFNTALDCGCGSGNILQQWMDRFPEIHALDLQTCAIREARQLHETKTNKGGTIIIHEGPAEDLRFLSDASVDFVSSAASAHWFDRARWLPEVARVLKPGGTLAVWSHHALPFDCDGSNELHDLYETYFLTSLRGLGLMGPEKAGGGNVAGGGSDVAEEKETETELPMIQGYSHGFSEGFESFRFPEELFRDVQRIYWNRPSSYPDIPTDVQVRGEKSDFRFDPAFMSEIIDYERLRGYHKSLSNFEEKWLQADPTAREVVDREWGRIKACFGRTAGTREVYWPCSLVLASRVSE